MKMKDNEQHERESGRWLFREAYRSEIADGRWMEVRAGVNGA